MTISDERIRLVLHDAEPGAAALMQHELEAEGLTLTVELPDSYSQFAPATGDVVIYVALAFTGGAVAKAGANAYDSAAQRIQRAYERFRSRGPKSGPLDGPVDILQSEDTQFVRLMNEARRTEIEWRAIEAEALLASPTSDIRKRYDALKQRTSELDYAAFQRAQEVRREAGIPTTPAVWTDGKWHAVVATTEDKVTTACDLTVDASDASLNHWFENSGDPRCGQCVVKLRS